MKGFTILKLSILGFGIFTIPEIIVMLFQLIFSLQVESILEYKYLSTVQFVCFFVVLLGFLILAFGIYSFASSYTGKLGKEGKRLSLYLIIFTIGVFTLYIVGSIFSLMMGDFQMISTLLDIAAAYSSNNIYRDWARMWALGIIVFFIFYVIQMIILSTWFNKVEMPFSERKSLLIIVPSVLYFMAAFFTFISVAMLFPPSNLYFMDPLGRITDLESVMMIIVLEDVVEAQLFSYFFLLLGFASQLIISVNMYLNLNRMTSDI